MNAERGLVVKASMPQSLSAFFAAFAFNHSANQREHDRARSGNLP